MRELKFRAWDTKHNVIVPWADISESRALALLVNNNNRRISNCVLMQHTGLKDKNGTDIYEGDIVECFSSYGGVFKAEVVFVDGCFEINEPKGKDGVFRDYLYCMTCNRSVKVIGNIYETPNLLTEALARK